MAKKNKQKQHPEQEDPRNPPAKMKRKEYEQEMRVLHGDQLAVQDPHFVLVLLALHLGGRPSRVLLFMVLLLLVLLGHAACLRRTCSCAPRWIPQFTAHPGRAHHPQPGELALRRQQARPFPRERPGRSIRH